MDPYWKFQSLTMCIFRFILRPKKIGFGELSFRNYADLEYRTLSNYCWHANTIPWSVFSKAGGLRQTLRIPFLIEHLQWLFLLFRNEFHFNYFFLNILFHLRNFIFIVDYTVHILKLFCLMELLNNYKSVQIRSYFWSVFFRIPNAGKYGHLDTFHAVSHYKIKYKAIDQV